MQLIEQLRLKQDRTATLLRSRKRKLCELYTATCNDAGDRLTTSDILTSPKLKAFLEANDLEKGRAFSESTLPPRPSTTRHLRSQNSPSLSSRSIEAPNNVSRGISPAKIDVRLSPRPRNESTPDGCPAPPSETPTRINPKPADGAIHHSDEPDSKKAVDRDESKSIDNERGLASKLKAAEATPTEAEPMEVDAQASLGLTDVTRLRRSRSPLDLAPIVTAADTQSSPASTNGPGSSNTPAPTAPSPETSPGDDVGPPEQGDFPPQAVEKPMLHNGRPYAEENSPGITVIDPDGSRTTGGSSTPQKQHVPSDQRRPNMRVETQAGIEQFFRPESSGGINESPSSMMTTATPRKTPTVTSLQDQSKRATRISSGALQKKSVSEILGETPRVVSPQLESPQSASNRDISPATAQTRLLDKERREKERSKLSTVVFAKPSRTSDASDTIELFGRSSGVPERSLPRERDYLYSLFESRAYSPPKNAALSALVHEARKTLTTPDHLIDYQEQVNCRTMKRIYQLQNVNRWPLRQLKRVEEVARPTSHWDFLLDHVKWMRTDFREERKWKIAAASALAEACAEWVASDAEERRTLQIQVKPPTLSARPESTALVLDDEPGFAPLPAQPTPDLVPSGEDESISDDIIVDPREISLADAPAAIFSLGARELSFAVAKTPASDKLLGELPLYEPIGLELDIFKSDLAARMDARWKQDIVPISKFTTERIRQKEPEPPRKRSRYQYQLEDTLRKDANVLPPRQTDVALFQPDNKHMRDRIHPGHSFRPPTEHPMPTQAFFESRQSSQWTHTEDDELRKLVKDYSYNWSLISACLAPKSMYCSGADRRTPWECFERWIGLEGLPADMSKTPYFRAYHSRIEAAGRHVQQQIEAAQARAGITGQPPRKRTTQPVRVERKRAQKHLAMLDAMRKLAKKRETAIQKQQHQADLAAMRKVNEANQPRPPISTPAEFSRLKHERELKMAERQEQYRQQLIAHQRATAQQQRNPGGQANGGPSGGPRLPNGLPNGPAALAGLPNGNLAVAPGHARPHPGMPGMPNGLPNGLPLPPGMMGPKASQVQMQLMAARMANSPESLRRMQEQAAQVQQQQLLIAQQVTRQNGSQNGSHSSPNIANASMANGNGINNAAYLANLAAGATGVPSPAPGADGQSRSPRNQSAMHMGQALSSGQMPLINQISSHIKQQNPHFTDEQVLAMATHQLSRYSQTAPAAPTQKQRTMNQAALNAAMGAVNAGANAANNLSQGMMTNEQVQAYNQQMRSQQARQRASAGYPNQLGPSAMPAAMGSSPVMNMARPVSQQGQVSRSATPREQRSGSNGNSNGTGNGSMMGSQGSPRQQHAMQQQQQS